MTDGCRTAQRICRSGAEQQVDVAVGDLGGVQPPARAVPLRRVVDHPEQGGEREPGVGAVPAPARASASSASRSNALRLPRTPRHAAPRSITWRSCWKTSMWSRWATTCATHRRTSARSCSAGSRGSASSASALLEQRVHQLVADRAQQLLLAAEVVVEAAGREAERLGELGHRGLVVAALGEHARRAEHDLRPAAVVALAHGGSGRAGRSRRPSLPNAHSKFE